MLLGVTLLGLIGQPVLGYRSISILYLLSIIILPFFCGRLIVFLGAGVSIVLWNLLFIPPKLTFSIASLEDILMFFAFFLTAFVGGYLTSRLKEKETALSLRERRIAVLYGFTRDISRIQGLEQIAHFSVNYLKRQLKLNSAILLQSNETDQFKPIIPDDETGMLTDLDFKKPLAIQCFNTNDSIEDGEDRLYLPLGSPKTKAGVLFVCGDNRRIVKGENRELLTALAGNAALTMEREILSAENERNKMANETARLSKILLNLVSHELRTPLTTIKGSVSGLLEGNTAEDSGLRETLLRETMIAANKLNIIVEDLLVMSRLESGRLRFHPELLYLGELIGAAKETLGIDLADRSIILEGVSGDSDIEADAALMVQVFRNILRNFAAYTPAECILQISVISDIDFFIIHFSDNGPGISEQDLPFVFDTFFRGSAGTYKQGCGLGLSICRGIIEVHRGMITAENITEGGLRIIIKLPRRGKE